MRHNSDRTIKVNKKNLIEKLKINKEVHIKEYEQACIDYKEEALKQLKALEERASKGDVVLHLNLVSPILRDKEYDKIIEMFNWEIEEEVNLSQDEFNQYVLDEFDFRVSARTANLYYSKSLKA